MAIKDPMESLVEEREAEMVSFSESPQKPIIRKALFLKPTSSNPSNFKPPPPPFFSNNTSLPNSPQTPNFHHDFRWWADPQFQWPFWVDKLKPEWATLWKISGIFDAVMESKYRIWRDPSSLLGISRFWSQETNTFIFPWGEATLTLEDVMVLGGFSVLGEPVRIKDPLGSYFGDMESKMIKGLKELKTRHGKVEHSVWLRNYMNEGQGGVTEHVAFLALWLSKFVLSDANGRTVRKSVFQIAVRLAYGVRIALAPAVLASVYRDIGVMKNYVLGVSSVLAIWAPINLLQLWIWERFSALRLGSEITNLGPMGGRRKFSRKRVFVMSILVSPNEFNWRPYLDELNHKHFMYVESGEQFCSSGNEDEGLQSFARCLRASELVGLDCIEQYLPHRVAMQFGFDQEIPCSLPRVDLTWELAWETYDIMLKNVDKYVHPRLCKVDVTLEYFNWWKGVGNKRKGGEHILPDIGKKKGKGFCSGGKLIGKLKEEERHIDSEVENELERRMSVWNKECTESEGTLPDVNKKERDGLSDETGETAIEKSKVEEEGEFGVKESEAENKVEELIEERNPVWKKELEVDLKIIKLKREIASIRARITCLESLPASDFTT